jgi:hypothetical protein
MEYNKTIKTDQDIIDYFKENPLLFNNIKKNIINLDKIKTEPVFRAYKDESTSCFVSVFMEDEDILNYFIYYNFQTLHYFIMSNINELLKTNKEVLKSDEDIFIIFKGGNIMHFYFNKIIKIIKDNLLTQSLKYIEKINDLDNNFKVSDVDTSILIINNDEQKFNLIYYYTSILLIKSLIFIRENFDKILNNESVEKKDFIKLPSNLVYINTYNDPKYDLYTIHTLYKNIASLFENSIKINDYGEEFINKLLEYISYFYIDSQYLIFKDSYMGSRYISIIQLIKFYYKTNKNIRNSINLNSILSNLINNCYQIIQIQNETILIFLNNKLSHLNNFYTKDKISIFLEKLLNKYNSEGYLNKNYFNQLTNPSTQLIIKEPVKSSELVINSRNDFLYRSVNSIYSNNLILFNNSASNHFISINNVISNYMSKEHIVIFDLYRIKFNVILEKIFNVNLNKNIKIFVPSEFFDISIPKFYDFNLCQLRKLIYNSNNYIHYFSKLDNNKLECYNILSTNLKYTIKDLNSILYEQNTFIPWNDLKYNKRIIRLLFLIFIVYYKKAIIYDSINLVSNILDTFINNLKELVNNILLWFSNNKNESFKENILNSINKLILFNDSYNNLLNKYTLANFYDYQNKSFFKIKYYEVSSDYEKLKNIFHGELDLSINVIIKIIFFIVENNEIYEKYINSNLDNYNYTFNSENDRNEYIKNKFLVEYIEFIKKFVDNITFMKELIFDKINKNINLPINDLLLGGSKSLLKTDRNFIQFINSKFTDISFKCMGKSKNNSNIDLDDLEMMM